MILRFFEKISYLIRSIGEVIYGMRAFLFTLFVAIAAFTDAFYSLDYTIAPQPEGEQEQADARLLEEVKDDEDQSAFMKWFNSFGLKYISKVESTYLLTNGEFPLDSDVANYDSFGWFIFLLATIFNLIIMLNLLITIISEDFASVIGTRDETMFRERVISITQLQRTIGWCVRQKKSNSAKLMFLATELKIDEIKTNVEHIEVMNDTVKEIRGEIQQANTNLD